MAFLWSLWPFNLNRWLFQLKLLHMIHISWKNYEILKFWVLDFGFGLQNFFWPLKVFLRSLVSNKSSGMQKSYVWAIFHAKQFLLPIFHFGSLCIKKQLPRTRWLSSARQKLSQLKSHVTPYKFNSSHWLKLQHSDWKANLVKDFFWQINFPPMRAV